MTPQRLRVDGREVRALVRPARGGPTALLLHGYPDTCEVFSPLVNVMDTSWGVVAPDFPGQGESEARPDTAHPEARASWCVKVLEAVEVKRPRVFGHDMGAHTALELALAGHVESVVVSHALLDGEGATSLSIQVMRASRAYRLALRLAPDLVFSRCLDTFFEGPSPSDAALESMRTAFRTHGAGVTVKVCDAAEVWLARGLSRFAGLDVPTTALWARRETHFPPSQAEALVRAHASTTLTLVDSADHWLCWNTPLVVKQALESLISPAASRE